VLERKLLLYCIILNAYIEEELLGLRFKITPFSFFQTNSLGAEVLYSKAREYVLSGGFGDVAGVDGAGG